MKAAIALTALLASATAHAADLADTPCGTGLAAICANPAPSIASLTYSPTYARLTVTAEGVQYVSAPYSATAQGGTVYAADGRWLEVTTVWATWLTCTRTGRGQSCIQHWELKSGSVQ